VTRSGWRDPRLWLGLLLITTSVVIGARVLASADDTVAVWAADGRFGAGAVLDETDVVARRVRFADAADEALYLSAAEPLPHGVVLARAVGEGELVARSALIEKAANDLLQVPLEVDPNRVPRSVAPGSVVDVYVTDTGRGSARGGGADGPALSEVTVLDAPEFEETFAVSGFRQIVVAVDRSQVPGFEALLGSFDDPVIRVLVRR